LVALARLSRTRSDTQATDECGHELDPVDIPRAVAVAHNDDVSVRSHIDVLTVGEVCVFTFMDPPQVLVLEGRVAR
jgi:hypothetical protein